jgi:ketosteroid isomerase-like protein
MTHSALGALSPVDVAAVRAACEQSSRFFLARDFDALVQLFTEDGVEMPAHEGIVKGRTALRRWMEAFPKVTHFKLEIAEIDGRADLAYVRGTYSMAFHPQGSPGAVDDVGKYIEIWKRQPDGSWLQAVDIFNSDRA